MFIWCSFLEVWCTADGLKECFASSIDRISSMLFTTEKKTLPPVCEFKTELSAKVFQSVQKQMCETLQHLNVTKYFVYIFSCVI